MKFAAAAVTLVLVLVLSSRAVAQSAAEHSIDTNASKASFGLAHIFVSRVTGTMPIVSGTIALGENSLVPVTAEAVLDARKVDTGDADQSACIRSADYFEANKFPEITFRSTRITPEGSTAFGMDGVLTVHGVAQLEHLEVTIRGDASHPVYHAVGRIDRHAFGMKGSRLDPVIGGMVDVTLDITLRP